MYTNSLRKSGRLPAGRLTGQLRQELSVSRQSSRCLNEHVKPSVVNSCLGNTELVKMSVSTSVALAFYWFAFPMGRT